MYAVDFCSSLKKQTCPEIPHLKDLETILGKNSLEGNLDILEVGKQLTSI
jgi:hypothetical protein